MVVDKYALPGHYIHDTDFIISQYENTLSKRISSKVLSASKTGKPAIFTDEETAYLTKKSMDEDPQSEVSIDTSVPDVTLKKGNTEINIKHAALLVKKMEEKYPTVVSKDNAENILKQPFYNPILNTVLKQEDNTPQQEIKTVNKNAYEIRLDILKEAIHWLSIIGMTPIPVPGGETFIPTERQKNGDDVIDLAKKFYSFVENRKY